MYEVVIDGPTKHPPWKLVFIKPTPKIRELVEDFLNKWEGRTKIPYDVLEEYANKLKELDDVKNQLIEALSKKEQDPYWRKKMIEYALTSRCHVFKVARHPTENNHTALRKYINGDPNYSIACNRFEYEIEMYRKTKDGYWRVI